MTIKVGLVQINNSFSGQNYFPYSVGLLQAYAEKYLREPSQYKFLQPIYSRIKIEEAVKKLEDADIVLFSVYVWNIRLSLKIAEIIKTQNAEKTIVFGGPHVPDNAENFLRKNTFINIAAHKEGEKIICPLLENYNDDLEVIPSISYLDKNGNYIQNKLAERIKDLDEIPSPYLEGIFNPLIESYPEERWLVMWETNRGCPFSCSFCDWGSATQAKVNKFGLKRLEQEIDWIRKQKIEFIFCCDANFGILKRDFEIAKYAAQSKEKFGFPQALSVQNTKNARDRAYRVQKFLSDYGLNKGVTLSLQSLDEITLKNVKRDNISLESYQELQHRFTKDKIETYSDMILGMPGETYDSFVDGISNLIQNGQHNRIQFGNLSILPNAEMGDPSYQKKFGMKIVETEIINIHGSLLDNEEIYEHQQMVIATNSMPKDEWVKTRAICWLTAFLHFDKVMQIPFVLLHKLADLSFRELIESFAIEKSTKFPITTEIFRFFVGEAKKIQSGGAEYCESKEWLNIWWPADELQLIKLCNEDRLIDFYKESEIILLQLLEKNSAKVPTDILEETIKLNFNLIKLPFQTEDLTIPLNYNIWNFYQNHLIGIEVPIEKIKHKTIIDRTSETWSSWEQWCQEVIWYGNKKGSYLYKVRQLEEDKFPTILNEFKQEQIAGHH